MFCLMDVSGSMDQVTKDMAKRFYILLYLFLSRTYKNVGESTIRHHTQAKEVDEHEFFYSQETGGTIVSSALKLMDEVVKARYDPSQWNIYAAQASDGDNWADDSPLCHELLAKNILPVVRYYSYIEITRRAHQTLWREYEHLQTTFENFAMQHIRDQEDIYPVFRELFHKQGCRRSWYAAPSPRADDDFNSRYRATFNAAPANLASLAYDAISLVALLAQGRALSPLHPEGADGSQRLRRRGRHLPLQCRRHLGARPGGAGNDAAGAGGGEPGAYHLPGEELLTSFLVEPPPVSASARLPRGRHRSLKPPPCLDALRA